jgi:hypothetical protein
MAKIKARQLLNRAAVNYKIRKENFNKQEIVKKINELKYLSAQKKVPKLTLKKEIIHLEKKLEGIFDLEKSMFRQRKRESSKVKELKKQISSLKKKLAVNENGDLQRKVEKLSHLLGDLMAKRETKKGVELGRRVSHELKNKKRTVKPVVKKEILSEDEIDKVEMLHHKLKMLKHEFEINKELGQKNPVMLKAMEGKIGFIEDKLKKYSHKNLTCPIIPEVEHPHNAPRISSKINVDKEDRHHLLFDAPPSVEVVSHENSVEETETLITDAELERELPLPPPPRMTR